MKELVVSGGKPLNGRIKCDGAKNAALPILAATLLTHGVTHLTQIPYLADVETMLAILSSVGASTKMSSGQVRVRAEHLVCDVPYELARMMRASFLVMGPLLVRCGEAHVPLPGGCAIGRRPVDLHLKGFEAMGAVVSMEQGNIIAKAPRLHGADIYLDVPSVGATENIMMAASLAGGVTTIDNAAQEPEIVDLANFLNAAGAKISGAGTSRIRIKGVKQLHGVEYTIIPDRIEAATYLVAAAATLGNICVENVIPYYEPLIPAQKRGRHLYWTNFVLPNSLGDRRIQISGSNDEVKRLSKFHDYNFLKYTGEQRIDKIARNLVDYEAGLTIFKTAFNIIEESKITQATLF